MFAEVSRRGNWLLQTWLYGRYNPDGVEYKKNLWLMASGRAWKCEETEKRPQPTLYLWMWIAHLNFTHNFGTFHCLDEKIASKFEYIKSSPPKSGFRQQCADGRCKLFVKSWRQVHIDATNFYDCWFAGKETQVLGTRLGGPYRSLWRWLR